LPDLPLRDALGFLGLGDAVAVAGQILGEKETVDRRLSSGAADAVSRIERIESRLGFRDVGAAIAVTVDATVGTARIDCTVDGDSNRQAGRVPGVAEANTISIYLGPCCPGQIVRAGRPRSERAGEATAGRGR
jgi:hypothetical protein